MVFVTNNFFMLESFMRFIAGPESTGWVIAAYISFAPCFFNAAAAYEQLTNWQTRSPNVYIKV
jgi:hypothetical protein